MAVDCWHKAQQIDVCTPDRNKADASEDPALQNYGHYHDYEDNATPFQRSTDDDTYRNRVDLLEPDDTDHLSELSGIACVTMFADVKAENLTDHKQRTRTPSATR